jgi:uncharacterized protein (TIGR02145 family)
LHGVSASGKSISIPYTGGDGGAFAEQSVASTGVTGLKAEILAGNFATGEGNLVYKLGGVPTSDGIAFFEFDVAGNYCSFSVTVVSQPVCHAKVDVNTYKYFMCHNLGAANTNADPFTPSWDINGGYWQWGRKELAAAGPSGPGYSQAGENPIVGWNTTYSSSSSWSDFSRTENDPCPPGYRVPTGIQWAGIVANNVTNDIGTWSSVSTNYESGKKIGPDLMLPAAGIRLYANGALFSRGQNGYYWSSTWINTFESWNLNFGNGSGSAFGVGRHTAGLSVRCIEE